jgi:hypothetical protein
MPYKNIIPKTNVYGVLPTSPHPSFCKGWELSKKSHREMFLKLGFY